MKHICQGPECHTYQTQSRIRGIKGFKVLRTRNARYDIEDNDKATWGYRWERYFCDERCMQDWLTLHMTQLMNFVGLQTKPKETPVEIVKETKEGWRGTYVDTTINFLHTNLEDDNITA